MTPSSTTGACRIWFVWSACLFSLTGCGGSPTRVPLDPEAVAQRALAEYDKNKDGKLDASELERCPALKTALMVADTNKDGCLDAEEIAERIRKYQAHNVVIFAFPCRVLRDGAEVPGATVTFRPEKFMGESAKPATGTSNAHGLVMLQVEGAPDVGVYLGSYRIEVSLKSEAGNEQLPARYNVNTNLGQEVAPDVIRREVVIRVTSS